MDHIIANSLRSPSVDINFSYSLTPIPSHRRSSSSTGSTDKFSVGDAGPGDSFAATQIQPRERACRRLAPPSAFWQLAAAMIALECVRWLQHLECRVALDRKRALLQRRLLLLALAHGPRACGRPTVRNQNNSASLTDPYRFFMKNLTKSGQSRSN